METMQVRLPEDLENRLRALQAWLARDPRIAAAGMRTMTQRLTHPSQSPTLAQDRSG